MVILKEAYTPLERFGDRVIDLKTFFEGIKANFKRSITISYFARGKGEQIIIDDAPPSKVQVTNKSITAEDPKTGLAVILQYHLFYPSIGEISNASSFDYVFHNNQGIYYRVKVR